MRVKTTARSRAAPSPSPTGTSNQPPSRTRHKRHRGGTAGHNVITVQATQSARNPRPLESEPCHLTLRGLSLSSRKHLTAPATSGRRPPCAWGPRTQSDPSSSSREVREGWGRSRNRWLSKREGGRANRRNTAKPDAAGSRPADPTTARGASGGGSRYPRGRPGARSRAPATGITGAPRAHCQPSTDRLPSSAARAVARP